jgi:hypothetical protein
MKWANTIIKTPKGEQQAISPLVISASRCTDIPAFHAKWFINRLREGYCIWKNPFNSKQQQYISFEKSKVFVFWSKHPAPLIPFLNEIEASGYRFYFQYTMNEYEQEGLEPRLPKLSQRLATFKTLSERIGKHRVIWRFDPIIMSNVLTVERVLKKILLIAHEVANYTEKLVFSYVDWYKKTENSLKTIDTSLRTLTQEEMWQLAMGITAINAELQSPLQLATCAETIDLTTLGIAKNKCIDDKLILRLYPEEPEILNLYGHKGTQASLVPLTEAVAKDTGQRTPCGCVPSKDIGSYNTCMHLCAYCYANQSQKAVISRMNTLNIRSERL